MNKSVVIIGKGPSVLKSTKEFVDSFDEVAICNFPPMKGYQQFIGERATYHFLNAADPNPYSREIINSLELKHMFNTHYIPCDGDNRIFPDHEVEYDKNYGKKTVTFFKENHGFDPSTGIQAFDYFVKKKEFTVIGLVGFDFSKVGERGYYYTPEEVQPSLKYLYSDKIPGPTPFTPDGVRIKKCGHGPEKAEIYVNEMIEYYNKELRTI